MTRRPAGSSVSALLVATAAVAALVLAGGGLWIWKGAGSGDGGGRRGRGGSQTAKAERDVIEQTVDATGSILPLKIGRAHV